MSGPVRPALRYHGGKWLLATWIISHFPPHRVYVEPFGGAASVLMQKPRSYGEVYNDLDGEIVNLFRVLRDGGSACELKNLLELTPFARDEYRASFVESTQPIEQARRTVIRSFMGFGSNSLNRAIQSGFRSNSNRSGTTPAHDWVNWPERIGEYVERLRGVVIENKNAADVIQQHDSAETLIYADPPYCHDTRMTVNQHGAHGYAHEMTDEDHRALAGVLRDVAGMVVLSGYACPLYDDELYLCWKRVERPALADGALPRVEILWLNPACAEALEMSQSQSRMFA